MSWELNKEKSIFSYHPVKTKNKLNSQVLIYDYFVKLCQETEKNSLVYSVKIDQRRFFDYLTKDGWLLLKFQKNKKEDETQETLWNDRLVIVLKNIDYSWTSYLFSVKRGK